MGGFSKAFELAGASVQWASDKDRPAQQTYEAYMPYRYILKDVTDLRARADGLVPVDILTAGFPCQPFSVAGMKKGFADMRGELFLHIIRLIREFGREKPKILLLENVRNLKTHGNGLTFLRIQSEIQRAGYWFDGARGAAQILNTMNYTDIPQNRDRLFMVAFSQDHFDFNPFRFPPPVNPKLRRSVAEFLDLHEKADASHYLPEYSKYHPMFTAEMDRGKEDSIYQLRRSYVRENKRGICFTLMANMGEGGHNVPVIRDAWGIRRLTPRECARLQGYEDSWFRPSPAVSSTQLYKQTGNTVTVSLVKRLADTCLACLSNPAFAKRRLCA